MFNKLDAYLQTPSKKEFAATFRVAGRISFWLQLFLGGVSGIALLFAIFSRNVTEETNSLGIGFGIALAIAGILLLCFRILWAFRYRQLAKSLQAPNPDLHPQRHDIIQVLRVGLIVSLIGLLIAFVASEETVAVVIAKALAQPQGVAIYEPENVIRSLDVFVLLSNVNMIGAHLVGSINSLALLNWLD